MIDLESKVKSLRLAWLKRPFNDSNVTCTYLESGAGLFKFLIIRNFTMNVCYGGWSSANDANLLLQKVF